MASNVEPFYGNLHATRQPPPQVPWMSTGMTGANWPNTGTTPMQNPLPGQPHTSWNLPQPMPLQPNNAAPIPQQPQIFQLSTPPM